jgi:hypothetical protein
MMSKHASVSAPAGLLTFGLAAEAQVLAAMSGDIGLRRAARGYPRRYFRAAKHADTHDLENDRPISRIHKTHHRHHQRRLYGLLGNLPADALRLHS